MIRFASKLNTVVVGAASKLFQSFVNSHSPNSVISYANKRFSNGKLYDTLGFKFVNQTKPNYWYVKDKRIVGSRIMFQKHKLKSRLLKFDDSLSEYQNMLLNGYDRIFDCGNLSYV